MILKYAFSALLVLSLMGCSTKKVVKDEVNNKPNAIVLSAQKTAPNAVVEEKLDGKNLYENNCAKCHQLYEPNNFSKREWEPILIKMKRYADLDDAQMASISGYLFSFTN